MNIKQNKLGNVNVIVIEGRLDTTNYGELESVLTEITGRNEMQVLLDITGLEYISSSGLRVLLMFLKKIRAAGGRFMLCGMSPDIREIFEISGFVNIFEIFDDQAAALRS